MIDLLDVVSLVTTALESAGVPYTVGGSLASSFSGEPRASIDADILVRMRTDQAADFLARLGDGFYADADALERSIRTGTNTNLIHHQTGIKVDLFNASSPFEDQQLARRRRVEVTPGQSWYIHSPEDILLQKLLWYERGGRVSDRQWRDAVAIVAVQGSRLDERYLQATAEALGLVDLLELVKRRAAPPTR